MSAGRCWRCGASVDAAPPRCAGCGALQPEPPGTDFFALLGLPRSHAVEPGEVERRWREAARHVHPDRFTRAEPRERLVAVARAARLNEAARTLRDPLSRASYLVALLAPGALEAARASPDPAFLEGQLDARERLARARAAGDGAALDALASEARARLAALEREVAALLAPSAPPQDALHAAARALAQVRYHQAVLEEAGPAPVPR